MGADGVGTFEAGGFGGDGVDACVGGSVVGFLTGHADDFFGGAGIVNHDGCIAVGNDKIIAR